MKEASNRPAIHAAFTLDDETWDILDREAKARHIAKSALIRLMITKLDAGQIPL